MTSQPRDHRSLARTRALAFVVTWIVLCGAGLASAQDEELIDIFGGLGTAEQYDEQGADEAARAKQAEGHGSVLGQVFDGESGATLVGVTVILQAAAMPTDGAASQFVATSGGGGGFEFASVPPGDYTLSFVKSGYRTAEIQNVNVGAGSITRNDFPMPRMAATTGGDILDLDAFVVDASVVGDMMDALDLRLEADGLLNVMSADDFSRFAAGDVAEALKRVSGVNIVEGQFAIIRGLEDRYSSTLYNGAVVPSPDPDRQSVQLDLFPSEVLANTIVAKSFSGELPSNSSGGSINMITHDYPEEFEISLKMEASAHQQAWDQFIELEDGNASGFVKDDFDAAGGELGLSIGGRKTLFSREFRAKGVANWSVTRKSTEGWVEKQSPRAGSLHRRRGFYGDLAFGELTLTEGRFDTLESVDEETFLGYAGFGFDIDSDGDHKIDSSFFYVAKEEQTVQFDTDGYIPDFGAAPPDDGYPQLFEYYVDEDEIQYSNFDSRVSRDSWIGGDRALREFDDAPPNKPAWWSNFQEHKSSVEERELWIAQVNGEHTFSFLDDLAIDWAANHASTEQDSESRGLKIYFDPDEMPDWSDPANRPTPPITIEDLGGEGLFRVNNKMKLSSTSIEEDQWFARLDAEYENESWIDNLGFKFTGGVWYEKAKRKVDADFLESPSAGVSQFFFEAESTVELSDIAYGGLSRTPDGILQGMRFNRNESTREILAGHAGLKTTLFEKIDLAGSLRIEDIKIESKNFPFTEDEIYGAPRLYPVQYLFFDRLDNNLRQEVLRTFDPEGQVFNDQLLGIDVEANVDCPLLRAPDFKCVDFPDAASLRRIINGKIDKSKMLPSLGFALRPIEGLSIRGVYSKTVARPSFREMGYYVTQEPGKSDLFVGNPQLTTSDVESYDGRIEYTFGDRGDLVAFSIFEKKIDDPIERIVIRDPTNFENTDSALFRTYFNNPNRAKLWGIEVEAQKTLDVFDFLGIGALDFLEYFSVGGNYTWIKARVDRVEEERRRAEAFFHGPENIDPGREILYTKLEKTRRLFGQPEWIANANVSFEQPDWGTRVTLAWFAISDVLDAAGSSQLNPSGTVGILTLDQYIDSYNQLDLIASQSFEIESLGTEISFKFSAKNLTNSVRREIYDPDQTTETITFKRFKVGRSFKFGVTIRGF